MHRTCWKISIIKKYCRSHSKNSKNMQAKYALNSDLSVCYTHFLMCHCEAATQPWQSQFFNFYQNFDKKANFKPEIATSLRSSQWQIRRQIPIYRAACTRAPSGRELSAKLTEGEEKLAILHRISYFSARLRTLSLRLRLTANPPPSQREALVQCI